MLDRIPKSLEIRLKVINVTRNNATATPDMMPITLIVRKDNEGHSLHSLAISLK
jgi:hypothetical protein